MPILGSQLANDWNYLKRVCVIDAENETIFLLRHNKQNHGFICFKILQFAKINLKHRFG